MRITNLHYNQTNKSEKKNMMSNYFEEFDKNDKKPLPDDIKRVLFFALPKEVEEEND